MSRAPTCTARGPLLAVLVLACLATLALPAAAGAKVPASFFGVSAVHPEDDEFPRMERAGFGSYRFGVSWRNIQKTRQGELNFASFDKQVRLIAEGGLRPVPLLFGTPRFIKKQPGKLIPPTRSKADRRAWQRFLTAAAERYGPGGSFWVENPLLPRHPIVDWILWNEQNARPYWLPKPNPREYAKLVKISDKALAEGSPQAKVTLGGMFGYPRDRRSIDARKFLQRFYRVKGIKRHFENVNVHPYGSGIATVKRQIRQTRSAMRKAGDGGAGILVGEVGWGSSGSRKNESVVGRKGQAKRLSQALKLFARKRKRWNLEGAYIYTWRDFNRETSCPWCPRAGLLSVKGKPKPAFGAVKRAIRSSR